MHEDGLPCAAGGQVRDRRLGCHVLHGVHADAQMRQERLRQGIAELIVNGGCTGWHAIAATITTERAEEGTVRWTGMQAVEAVDDVESFLVRLQRFNRLGQLGFGQRRDGRLSSRRQLLWPSNS